MLTHFGNGNCDVTWCVTTNVSCCSVSDGNVTQNGVIAAHFKDCACFIRTTVDAVVTNYVNQVQVVVERQWYVPWRTDTSVSLNAWAAVHGRRYWYTFRKIMVPHPIRLTAKLLRVEFKSRRTVVVTRRIGEGTIVVIMWVVAVNQLVMIRRRRRAQPSCKQSTTCWLISHNQFC